MYPGFQSQGGCIGFFLTCVILRLTSGVIAADYIEVIMVAELTDVSASIGGGLDETEA